MTLDQESLARFATDLDALVTSGSRLGIAVSGGPDSLALLLLAHAVRPGAIEAATVDHRIRSESGDEAAMVARVCADLDVRHAVLTADWAEPPAANLQAEARTMRYRLLGAWAKARGLAAVATAHHADDQAETLLMRLARGAGVSGLAGVRASRALTTEVALLRPLLDWRKAELEALVADSGLIPVDDPSNRDPAFDRARMRTMIGREAAFDPARISRSAAALADANEALEWTTEQLAKERMVRDGEALVLDPAGLPRDLERRLLLAAFRQMGADEPRGPDLMRAMAALTEGGSATLSGLKMRGGKRWRIERESPRR
jgi:tRNA(Ile)-lysidine synthase